MYLRFSFQFSVVSFRLLRKECSLIFLCQIGRCNFGKHHLFVVHERDLKRDRCVVSSIY
jgi:hypothetical protein